MDLQEYGALIREHRHKAGLSQRQLAAEFGMSRTTISHIETGAISEIGVRKLSRLCWRLGLEVRITAKRTPGLDDLLRERTKRLNESLRQTSAIISGPEKRRKKTHPVWCQFMQHHPWRGQ